MKDIRAGRDVIVSQHPKRPRTLLNAVGLPIGLSEPPEDRLAHLIQGVEAQALRAVQALYREDIVLLMHDGWVSRVPLDKTRMVQKSAQRETRGADRGFRFPQARLRSSAKFGHDANVAEQFSTTLGPGM